MPRFHQFVPSNVVKIAKALAQREERVQPRRSRRVQTLLAAAAARTRRDWDRRRSAARRDARSPARALRTLCHPEPVEGSCHPEPRRCHPEPVEGRHKAPERPDGCRRAARHACECARSSGPCRAPARCVSALRVFFASDVRDRLAVEGVGNLGMLAPQLADGAVDDVEQRAAAERHRDGEVLLGARERRESKRVAGVLARSVTSSSKTASTSPRRSASTASDIAST